MWKNKKDIFFSKQLRHPLSGIGVNASNMRCMLLHYTEMPDLMTVSTIFISD